MITCAHTSVFVSSIEPCAFLIINGLCLHSENHMFYQVLMEIAQNVCLDNMSGELATGICVIRNNVSKANHKKTVFTLIQAFSMAFSSVRDPIFTSYFVLMEIPTNSS